MNLDHVDQFDMSGPTRFPPRVAGHCRTHPCATLCVPIQNHFELGWVLQYTATREGSRVGPLTFK